MAAGIHRIAIAPDLLARGFWLYVWKVRLPRGDAIHYVGMTGDTGSYRAQSPFNRISAHLGSNQKSNALRDKLQRSGIAPEACQAIDFTAYGPLYEVPSDRADYQRVRGKVAALEKQLWIAIKAAGHNLLNKCPAATASVDAEIWSSVSAAFADFV